MRYFVARRYLTLCMYVARVNARVCVVVARRYKHIILQAPLISAYGNKYHDEASSSARSSSVPSSGGDDCTSDHDASPKSPSVTFREDVSRAGSDADYIYRSSPSEHHGHEHRCSSECAIGKCTAAMEVDGDAAPSGMPPDVTHLTNQETGKNMVK